MPSSITLTVSHLASSTSFFLSALQPLDYAYRGRVGDIVGFGTQDAPPDFWISQEKPGVPAGAAHVAFPAMSKQRVQDFFVAALKAGGKVHGEPFLRDPNTGYYSAAVIDLDGNSIEAVYRDDLQSRFSDDRQSSGSSVASSKFSKQERVMSSTPTIVSKAKSKAAAEARSVAPSQVSRAPTQTSKAPTSVSQVPSTASQPATQPDIISTTQTLLQTTPQGEVVASMITEAKGAINVAKELQNHVRPTLEQSNSAPNILTKSISPTMDSNSHKPSDTIVDTLLGVAAGAALTYAYNKSQEGSKLRDAEIESLRAQVAAQQLQTGPGVMRSGTVPTLSGREYDYHDQLIVQGQRPYAIEGPPSEYSRASGPRMIEMVDNDDRLSSYTSRTARPRRRSSASEMDSRTLASASRASQHQKLSTRALETPPTSYKNPTVVTQLDGTTASSNRSKARSSSTSTRRSSTSKRRSSDERSQASTIKPIKNASSASKPSSRAPSRTSTIDPANRPLPPSRAASNVTLDRDRSDAGSAFYSTHSKSNKTVIRKMVERERTGGRSELTKSVVGKIEGLGDVKVSNREVDPSDSVSQISSVRSSKSKR